MNGQEKLRLTMQEVGPRDDGIDQVLQTGEETWAVRFEDVDVEVEFNPQTQRAMFSADIGVPPEERRLPICEAVLVYSMLWRETGGLRMAMNETGGPITQMVDVDCITLTIGTAAAVLHNLRDRTLIWRKFFYGTDEALPAPLSPTDIMIRI